MADYKAGRGMGFALAAELNGYPGPKHVLELADDLGLSFSQRDEVEALFESMRSAAIELGERIVAVEKTLDAEFASNDITKASLQRTAEQIGLLNGKLRSIHLAAHLETRTLLSPKQMEMYVKLRGYRGEHNSATQHRHGG